MHIKTVVFYVENAIFRIGYERARVDVGSFSEHMSLWIRALWDTPSKEVPKLSRNEILRRTYFGNRHCDVRLGVVRALGKEVCRLMQVDTNVVDILVHGPFVQAQIEKYEEFEEVSHGDVTNDTNITCDISVILDIREAVDDIREAVGDAREAVGNIREAVGDIKEHHVGLSKDDTNYVEYKYNHVEPDAPDTEEVHVLLRPKVVMLNREKWTRMMCELNGALALVGDLDGFKCDVTVQTSSSCVRVGVTNSEDTFIVLLDLSASTSFETFLSVHHLAFNVLENTFLSLSLEHSVSEIIDHTRYKEMHLSTEGKFNFTQHQSLILAYIARGYSFPNALQECLPKKPLVVRDYPMFELARNQRALYVVQTIVNCMKVCGMNICSTLIFGGFVRDGITGVPFSDIDVRCAIQYNKKVKISVNHKRNCQIMSTVLSFVSVLLKADIVYKVTKSLYVVTELAQSRSWVTHCIVIDKETPQEICVDMNINNDSSSMSSQIIDYTVNGLCIYKNAPSDMFVLEPLRDGADIVKILEHLACKKLYAMDPHDSLRSTKRLEKMLKKGFIEVPKSTHDLIEWT